ncbi:MAG TPA: GNAT family N-acetyltransferase [Ktedonobacterales bacterium]|nr:GNAT family N-acetyltransferase [Ktedonobacterales bacterium]
MTIEIRELTPALVEDYLTFFDHDAFADNPRWAACYCMFPHINCDNDTWDARSASVNRAEKCELICASEARGWLAYVDGQPAGWCNAAQRTSLARYRDDDDLPREDAETSGTIVCFIIAKPYRRLGVASLLLDAAVEGFRRQGLRYAEAFPMNAPADDAEAHVGPLSMYLAAGFEPLRYLENGYAIVRKILATEPQSKE